MIKKIALIIIAIVALQILSGGIAGFLDALGTNQTASTIIGFTIAGYIIYRWLK